MDSFSGSVLRGLSPRFRWRYELIEGAWDRKGVLMFYSTVIEGAASYVDAILSLGKVFDRINENRQGNRGDGNE